MIRSIQQTHRFNGLTYYAHTDHLGSTRFASTTFRSMYFDMAYAPFGETYALSGSTDPAFTTQRQDTVAGLYDFPAREYSIQGRWPSPDPAGLAAVDLSNPQSWNRYAYVQNNPLNSVDPLGTWNIPGYRPNGGVGGSLVNLYWALGYGSVEGNGLGGSGTGGCTLDGVGAPCGIVFGILQSGAGAVCPNNDCSGTTLKGDTFYANIYSQSTTATNTLNNCVPFGEGMCQGSIAFDVTGGWRSVPVGTAGDSSNIFWTFWSAYWQKVPLAGSFSIPLVPQVGLIASVPFAYTPGSQTGCVGGGLGFATPGKAVNGGPLLLGNLPNSQSVLSGQSLSFNVQATPILGVQYITNRNGSLGGPTVGTPGGSIAYTGSACGPVN